MFNKPIECKNFSKIEKITPDIRPSIVLSQTKLENFEVLRSVAFDYKVPFVHYESNLPPYKTLPSELENLKELKGNINIYTNSFIMEQWGDNINNSLVIENGWGEDKIELEQLYYISTNLPIAQMSSGICPIVLKTPYSEKYIKNGLNGFLYSSELELSNIVNNLNKMEKEDIISVGKYAQKVVSKHFPRDKFLNAWKKILRSAI